MGTNQQPACHYCGTDLTAMGIASMQMEWPEGLKLEDATCCDMAEHRDAEGLAGGGKSEDPKADNLPCVMGKLAGIGDAELVGVYLKGEKTPRTITGAEARRLAASVHEVIYDCQEAAQ